MKTRILFFAGLLGTLTATAQSFSILDQTPSNLRWYRLKTPHFRVLYPEGFEQQAQRTAYRLEQVYEPVSASLERRPRPISVLLQNQTTITNGFVTLTPRRSEFFAVQPQDPFIAGNNDWIDLLALHEYRHVVQNEKALYGFSGLLSKVFGSYTQAAVGLGIPNWFDEGDAVGTETLLSRFGRGRIPNFDLGMRANLLAGRRFNYSKSVAGSYVQQVPDHYVLGYFLSTYLKNEFGANAWSTVLNRYYSFPFYPFSFSNSLKKTTHYRVEELYRRSLDEANESWRKQQEGLKLTEATPFPVRPEKTLSGKAIYTNYRLPQYLTDNAILCFKSGLGDITQLVQLSKDGVEKKVHLTGLYNDAELLSVGGSKVCWVEYRYHPRWRMQVWSEIRVLDLKTGKLYGPFGQRLTDRSRYTAASLSPDGAKIVAVENTPDYKTRLVVMESEAGGILKVIENATDDIYLHPRWKADSRTIITVTLKRQGASAPVGKTIQAIDSQEGTTTDLMPVTTENISNPQPWGNYVLYNSPQSGIDNIYALDTRNGQTYQVTSRKLGAYHATISPNQQQLAFSDFTADGFRVVEMPLRPEEWVRAETIKNQPIRYFGPSLTKESGVQASLQALQAPFPTTPLYTAERYRRLPHAINVMGLGPVATSDGQTLTASLQSQDLLSTTQASVGYAYNQAERTGTFLASLSYQGLFPVFDINFQRGTRSTSLYIDRRMPLDSLRSDRWQYNQLSAGVRIPLLLTQSRFSQNLTVSAYYNLLQVKGYDLPGRYYSEVGYAGPLNAMTYNINYALLLRQSKRDVAPRWGLALNTTLRHTPFGGTLNGQQWGASGSLFLPGLGKHHSIRLRGGYQQQNSVGQNTYRFSGTIFYPRGYDYIGYDKLLTGSAEYRLPLLSPHWTLGRWLYIQRVVGAGFIDGAQGNSVLPTANRQTQTISEQLQAVGFDVQFTFNVMRFRLPFEAGFRSIYNRTTGKWLYEPLVLNIGF